MTLACIDGGLICGPIAAVIGLGSLIAWFRRKRRCEAHECHDHPCEGE